MRKIAPLLAFLFIIFGCASTRHADKAYYESVQASFSAPNVTLPDLTSRENLNGSSPSEIHVKSMTQTFLKDWQFMIKDGKIWRKAAPENPEYEKYSDWELFLGTGLPFYSSLIPVEKWKSPDSITEIFADGDCLFAFDDKARMYFIYTQKLADEKVWVWSNVFGWPKKEVLYQNELVRDKRGWAMGVRRSDILWYEDRFGNQHHYGTMGLATVYFLSEDGQKIYFTDSGMPVDFSNKIQNPENGRFVARNISCSGSTLFLIADDGTMYTRLIDFDTMGCDPMFFKYTYENTAQKWTGKDYLSNYTLWGLPAEDWKKENQIPLSGKARLSRFISIHQNGQGNFARELRVAGLNSEGKTGYYFKQLSDSEWNFKPVNLILNEDDFLSGEHVRGNPTEFHYSGNLVLGKKRIPEISCTLKGMNLASEGKFTLSLKMAKDGWSEARNFTLYNVEMWTYKTRYNPGFDGTPKRYFVTLDLDSAYRTKDGKFADHEEFASLLENLFSKNDKALFALAGEAATNYVRISGKCADGKDFSVLCDSDDLGSYSAKVKVISASDLMLPVYSYEKYAFPEKEFYSKKDYDEIRKKIDVNKKFISYLNGEIAFYGDQKDGTNAFRVGFRLADFVATVTLLNQIDFPKFKTMASFGNRLIDTNAENFRAMYEVRFFMYPALIELAKLRIKSYENLLKKLDYLENENEEIGRDKFLRDSFPDYFALAKIPQKIDGKSPSAKKDASLYYISELPLVGAFFLTIDDETIFVQLEDSAEKIYAAAAEGISEKNPVKINVSFADLPDISGKKGFFSKSGIAFLSRRKGKLTWDGEKITISVKTGIFSNIILFE